MYAAGCRTRFEGFTVPQNNKRMYEMRGDFAILHIMTTHSHVFIADEIEDEEYDGLKVNPNEFLRGSTDQEPRSTRGMTGYMD